MKFYFAITTLYAHLIVAHPSPQRLTRSNNYSPTFNSNPGYQNKPRNYAGNFRQSPVYPNEQRKQQAVSQSLNSQAGDSSLPPRTFNTASLGIDANVKQFSGYIDDNPNDKHFFYWFFESRSNPANDPLVLWLNGGPGCSGLMGVFMQGPSNIKNDRLVRNPYSLTNKANVIFLDQPVNTGFSHSGGRINNSAVAAKDVYTFLTLFLKKFPQYANKDLHLSGESYAGQFIPVFAKEILSHKAPGQRLNLKSILIGSGILDAKSQYQHYPKMACGKSGFPAFLDPATCGAMEASLPQCVQLIDNCYNAKNADACGAAQQFCYPRVFQPFTKAGRGVYDVRKKCNTPGAICGLGDLRFQDFINSGNMLKTLGVDGSTRYAYCNSNILQEFAAAGDSFYPNHRYLSDILREIPVFIYGGDADYICPLGGTQDTLEALPWSGKSDYNQAPWQPYSGADGQKVGITKSAKGLKFTRIKESGHEVGWFQPATLSKMFDEWLASVSSKTSPT
ncbi:hypothetical protein H072_9117 [Dactylellina haptotyla CBS 200.50]|uniref:Carboxypeptidase n=1 Tax=Dactylellina haptotyla (strain CBS 200.50) TaxID=1284197 RepID=S8BDD7_DACHA|nr:hypothetical protein H072_9117 [Dactylellina haptotyla CBS 200.50]